MSRNKRLSIVTAVGLFFIAMNTPVQAVVTVSYSPYYGVAVNNSDRGHRQQHQRANNGHRVNSGYGYHQASPRGYTRSYIRSPRDHFNYNSRNYRRSNKSYFRSGYDRYDSGRRYDRNDAGRRCD